MNANVSDKCLYFVEHAFWLNLPLYQSKRSISIFQVQFGPSWRPRVAGNVAKRAITFEYLELKPMMMNKVLRVVDRNHF